MTNLIPGFTLTWIARVNEQREHQSTNPTFEFSDSTLRYQHGGFEIQAILPSWSTQKYIETLNQTRCPSFVLLFGACLWKDRPGSWLSIRDLQHCLESHQSVGALPLTELDGNFCLISYDAVSRSVWVGTDFWSTVGFHYGQRENLLVVSSRAAVVADRVRAPIDAMAYLSLVRTTVPAAGSSLFCGVSRITMGQALHFTQSTVNLQPVPTGALYRDLESWSFRETVERSKLSLKTTVADCVNRPQTVVDLTAGNDTRLIAAALSARPEVTAPLVFRVLGSEMSPDVEIATAIAKRFNWRYVAQPRLVGGLLPEHAPEIALAADGTYALDGIADRLLLEESRWPDARHLVGGLAGELFRSWIWQQELHRAGRTTSVDYAALLRHRVPRDHEADIARITGGRIGAQEHDEWLMAPLRKVGEQYPSALNVSKLDLYYIQRLMYRIPWWAFASHLLTITPFLWARTTDVSLRMPWQYKRTRRLVTTVVEELSPSIATFPTDRHAPFRSFRLGTALSYARYFTGYAGDIILRHYLRKTPAPLSTLASTPPQQNALQPALADWLTLGRVVMHEENDLADAMKRNGGNQLTNARRAEFLAILQVQLLCRQYRGIRQELVFS